MHANQTPSKSTANEAGRSFSRQDFLKGLAAAGFVAGGELTLSGQAFAHTGGPADLDPVQHLAYDELKVFTEWLEQKGARGYIGEVAWAGDERERFGDAGKWNALAEKWYGWADEAGLWVTAHTADERQLYGGFQLSVYASSGDDLQRAISEPRAHARVVENHLSDDTTSYKRGLDMPSGANIDSATFHQGNLGDFDEVGENSYWYSGIADDGPGGKNSFGYLHGRGIRLARLGFRWERFMPGGPGTALDQEELSRYKASVAAAGKAGIEVVLDCHNYGGYYFEEYGRGVRHPIGSERLTTSHFVDLWAKLSDAFKDDPAVIAYDLMNEPYADGGIVRGSFPSRRLAWEDATQQALSKIRKNGDGKLVMVPAYGNVGDIQETHPEKWISDPAGNHMYTVHHYFDTYRRPDTGGGHYVHSYDDESAYLQAQGVRNYRLVS